jgi:hypothetical protein
MGNVERSGTAPGALRTAASPRWLSRFDPLLKRLLVVGAVAFLAAFLCGSTAAQNSAAPEVKSQAAPSANRPVAAARHHHSSDEEAIPLLFLALMGLAALTLSQIPPTSESRPRASSTCAGKNVAPGQELPETATVPNGIATR